MGGGAEGERNPVPEAAVGSDRATQPKGAGRSATRPAGTLIRPRLFQENNSSVLGCQGEAQTVQSFAGLCQQGGRVRCHKLAEWHFAAAQRPVALAQSPKLLACTCQRR